MIQPLKPDEIRETYIKGYSKKDALRCDNEMNGALEVSQAEYKNTLRQVVDDIGLNCYIVWAEVDGKDQENICIPKTYIQELKQQVED